ncbi:substrate-binding domain-containing protein [Methylothermus subterraneus]
MAALKALWPKAILWFWVSALLALAQLVWADERLLLATTTSTENSGLLAVLNPAFEKRTGIKIDVLAVGSGQALALGKNCDVDTVLAHAPEAEKAFVQAGYGVNRRKVMHNDFLLVGPEEDPAKVKSAKTAADALRRIAKAQAPFVSRGDNSGTHQKEIALWRQAGIVPQGRWYFAIGQGMEATLQFAAEKRAYALSDRGTFLALQSKLELSPVFEGDPQLFNPYHIIAVNPKRCPNANYEAAIRYAAFLTGPEGQKLIAEFKIAGQRLFQPDALDY